jgi:hypothetical protein
MEGKLKGCPGGLELVRVDVHADTHRYISKTVDVAAVKPGPLGGPCLIGVIERAFPIVGHILAITVDNNERVEKLLSVRRMWPESFRITHSDGAVVF